ncbi:triose-phosphate isomerase [Anaerofilum sp. BX8]|uniref:Triosephosphate isomerase n=1 Tax=Anaerofilum hominis TaxID=2763016 RepID=A0A923I5Z6_9FIRM|nr:triose-phosphate isomerase [Anaerofilum hominis]MBC5580936.1 triose-phosphate isomerase [Anaerofilum hominis]
MKKIYFGTNLKMYKDIRETKRYLSDLEARTRDISRAEIELFVLPSFTSLPDACRNTDRRLIRLGAQNMCWEEQGQFTGEVSPLMLQELGLDLVMAGHSERRHVFRETDKEENCKVRSALEHGFTALLCIGETAEEKECGLSDASLRGQLLAGLDGIWPGQAPDLWIAYEPVWAIGVEGVPATAEYAAEKHRVIRCCLKALLGEAGAQVPILYGGSVNPDNADEFITCAEIDGMFVGRSAWQAQTFEKMIRSALAAARRAGK